MSLEEKLQACSKKTPNFSLEGQMKLCKVVDVYDGDTCKVVFDMNGDLYRWNVRMDGYDTPEIRPRKTVPNRDIVKKAARESRDFFKSLVCKDPEQLVYILCGGFDKYGRLLGKIYVNQEDDQSVNEIMIEKGYGYEYHGGTKKK